VVGTAAPCADDQLMTPCSNNLPGFEKNATVIHNIIHRQFLKKGGWAGPLDVSVIILFGLTLGYVLPKVRALAGTGIAASALLGYTALAQYLFGKCIWINVVNPVLPITGVFPAMTVPALMTGERQ